jgi:hypothetical protein
VLQEQDILLILRAPGSCQVFEAGRVDAAVVVAHLPFQGQARGTALDDRQVFGSQSNVVSICYTRYLRILIILGVQLLT